MASQFLIHITTAGERWDTLAWTYYGDPTLFSPIVIANPRTPIEPVFEAGLSIGVPILQMTPVFPADLPP
ncbi:MAG TPA: tail protein X [Candidatus Binataceae bacterium]|nr:tail protein X [Candidatus Binataceae bacterium]